MVRAERSGICPQSSSSAMISWRPSRTLTVSSNMVWIRPNGRARGIRRSGVRPAPPLPPCSNGIRRGRGGHPVSPNAPARFAGWGVHLISIPFGHPSRPSTRRDANVRQRCASCRWASVRASRTSAQRASSFAMIVSSFPAWRRGMTHGLAIGLPVPCLWRLLVARPACQGH